MSKAELISTVADVPFSILTVMVESALSTTLVMFWSSVLSNAEEMSTVAEAPSSIFTVMVESALSTTEVMS